MLAGLLLCTCLLGYVANEAPAGTGPATEPSARAGLLAELEARWGGTPIASWELHQVGWPEARVYLVRYDWEPRWWGSWAVVGLDDALQLEWVATQGETQAGTRFRTPEQSIHSLRALTFKGQRNPYVEVVGTTHMGHGNLYLYELDLARRTLVPLLETFVRDQHDDATLILGDSVLDRAYRDVNSDGFVDVEISGKARIDGKSEGEVRVVVALRRVFLWSPTEQCFEETVAEREGFNRVYPDRL